VHATRLLKTAAITAAIAALNATSAHAGQMRIARTRAGKVAPGAILAPLRQGQPVILSRVTIAGRLDLGSLGTVRQPFKCRGCTFTRGVDASDVVFERTVDLSGSTFRGPADFEGTTFRGPALFTNTPRPAEFQTRADFRLAVFEDLAAFDEATFDGFARFSLARFRSDASFALTTFENVVFDGAALAEGAIFDTANFDGYASFDRSSLGRADFRGAIFSAAVTFEDSAFIEHADFSGAQFDRATIFDDAQFPMGGAFVGTDFNARRPSLAASFDGVVAGGTLDFSFASFTIAGPVPHSKRKPQAISVSDLTSAGTVSFSEVDFPGGYSIEANDFAAKNLFLSVKDAARVDDELDQPEPHQRQMLELIESSAKARGDLATANDADYRLHVLASRRDHWPRRALDIVFYRGIAGYFVRPLRPLIALVALALVLAFARLFLGRDSEESHPPSRRRLLFVSPRRTGRRSARLVNEFLDALARVLPARRTNESELARLGHRLEAVLYRVLIACALIGLASSNPTLRRLVDSLL
jgi:uncharacterized protein YjbI with pentapeptide repeats